MSSKKYLTGYVHRLEDGVLKTYAPGDVAPDWVTNPKILTDKRNSPDSAETPDTTGESTPSGEAKDAGDDLTGLGGPALKAIAGELGLARNGSLDAIRDRIRAKRAEQQDTPPVSDDEDRDALVEKAKALGIEVDDQLTDVELQALIEAATEEE